MGKLKQVAPRVAAPKPRLARRTDAEGHGQGEWWRRWYGTARWRDPDDGLRIRVFRRDGFTCRRCGRFEPRTELLVGDHDRPVRDDPERLFWDEDNVVTLCKPCHDGPKQAEERRARFTPTPR